MKRTSMAVQSVTDRTQGVSASPAEGVWVRGILHFNSCDPDSIFAILKKNITTPGDPQAAPTA